MTDDFKKGLVTGLAMQPLPVVEANPDSPSFFEVEMQTISGKDNEFIVVNLGDIRDIQQVAESLANAIISVTGWKRDGLTITTDGGFKIELIVSGNNVNAKTFENETHCYTKVFFYGSSFPEYSAYGYEVKFIYLRSITGKSIAITSTYESRYSSEKSSYQPPLVFTGLGSKEACFVPYAKGTPFNGSDGTKETAINVLLYDGKSLPLNDTILGAGPSYISDDRHGTYTIDYNLKGMMCKFPNVLDGTFFDDIYMTISLDFQTRSNANYPGCIIFKGSDGKRYHSVSYTDMAIPIE